METLGKYSLCRLCLQNNQSLVDIFEENVEHGFIIKDAIEDLMQFEVSQVKGIPWMACSRCLVKLNDFRLFKIQCIDSKIAFETKFSRSDFVGEGHRRVDMSETKEMKDEMQDSHIRQDLYPEIEISPVKVEQSEPEIAQEFYPQVILKTMDENDGLESSSMSFNHSNNDANRLITKVGDSSQGRSDGIVVRRGRKFKRKKVGANCVNPEIDISRVKAEFQRQLQREVIPDEHYLEDVAMPSHLENDEHPDVAEEEDPMGFEDDWNGRFYDSKQEDQTWPVRRRKKSVDGKSYSCTFCGKTFHTRSELKRHARCHTGERPYLCDICGISFARRYHLVQHNMIHTGEKPFRCENCDKCFSKSSHLNRHRRTHTGERPYSCLICGKSFSLNYNLNAHMKVHCVEGQEQDLPCPHCEKRFTYKHNLLQHLKRHETPRTYNCQECNMTFALKGELARHATEHHASEKPCCCVECLECFPNKFELTRHTQQVHIGLRPYTCEICNNSFAENSELTKHRHTHGTGPKRFSCVECDKTFNRKSRLQRHISTVHGKSVTAIHERLLGTVCENNITAVNERHIATVDEENEDAVHEKLITAVHERHDALIS